MLHLKTRKSDAIFHGFCTLWSYTYFFVAWSSHSYLSVLKWCIEQLELELSVLPPFIHFWEMFLDYLPSCFNAIHKWFLLVNTHCFKASTNNSYLHLTDVGRCWQSCGNYFIAAATSAGVSPLSLRIGLTWRKFHQEKLLVIILFLKLWVIIYIYQILLVENYKKIKKKTKMLNLYLSNINLKISQYWGCK